MASNTSPIFLSAPKISWSGGVATANTDNSMTTGTSYVLFTAGTNGSKVENVSIWHLGTNISTVIRFFVNNGSTTATTANNVLVQEFTLTANTVSQVAASVPVAWPANLYLGASYKVYVTTGSSLAAGAQCIAQGGDY